MQWSYLGPYKIPGGEVCGGVYLNSKLTFMPVNHVFSPIKRFYRLDWQREIVRFKCDISFK